MAVTGKLAAIAGMVFSSNAVAAKSNAERKIAQPPDRIDVYHHIIPPVYTAPLPVSPYALCLSGTRQIILRLCRTQLIL